MRNHPLPLLVNISLIGRLMIQALISLTIWADFSIYVFYKPSGYSALCSRPLAYRATVCTKVCFSFQFFRHRLSSLNLITLLRGRIKSFPQPSKGIIAQPELWSNSRR